MMERMRKQRRSKRPIFFVCSAIVDGELVSESVEAEKKENASEKFEATFKNVPSIISGPFYRKRVYSTINTTDIVLSGEVKLAEYNGWLVNATLLKSPENFAFLLFDRRLDGKKTSKPTGMKIVSTEQLKFKDL